MNRHILSLFPLLLPALLQAQSFAGGTGHTLAVCGTDGSVMAWGYNAYGQLGNGTTTESWVPLPVNDLTGVVAVSAGEHLSLALKADGTVWSWGGNDEGELGNGTTDVPTSTPGQVVGLSGITAIAGDCSTHALALKNDGTVWCWGRDADGELGDGANTASNVPVQAQTPAGIIAIAGGGFHSMALRNDGTVWTWGDNEYGMLGDGTILPSNVPEQVAGLSGIVAIAGGGYHSMALKNDGTVWTWGYNLYGQLGDGTTTLSTGPVAVAGLSGVMAISGGGFYSLALKTDGTVWTWGANSHGELGNGSTIGESSSSPVQVSALSGTLEATAGYQHGLALTPDGQLHAWGNDIYGTLGDGNHLVDSNIPIWVLGVCPILVGVNEHAAGSPLSFFPNPTNGRIQIQGLAMEDITGLWIHDVLGRELRTTAFDPVRSEINLSAEPSGVYLITIGTAGGTVSARVVKE